MIRRSLFLLGLFGINTHAFSHSLDLEPIADGSYLARVSLEPNVAPPLAGAEAGIAVTMEFALRIFSNSWLREKAEKDEPLAPEERFLLTFLDKLSAAQSVQDLDGLLEPGQYSQKTGASGADLEQIVSTIGRRRAIYSNIQDIKLLAVVSYGDLQLFLVQFKSTTESLDGEVSPVPTTKIGGMYYWVEEIQGDVVSTLFRDNDIQGLLTDAIARSLAR